MINLWVIFFPSNKIEQVKKNMLLYYNYYFLNQNNLRYQYLDPTEILHMVLNPSDLKLGSQMFPMKKK